MIALVANAFTAAFMGVYTGLDKIWTNNWNYVTSHRRTIPLGVMSRSAVSCLHGLLFDGH